MGLATLPTQTDGSLGRPKKWTPLGGSESVLLDYDFTPEEWNARGEAIAALAAEVGVTDGSTPGSLVERVGDLEALPASTAPAAIARAAVVGVGTTVARADHVHDGGVRVIRATITSSTALVAGDEICRVNTGSGAIVLTLPDPSSPRDFLIKKINTGTNSITLRPHLTTGSGPTIEGGSAGADLLLDGSGDAARGAWYVFSDGANWWVG